MSAQLTVVEIGPDMPAHEAAAVIQKHRVLVLVNLNGWTLHDRNDVFALQPSPVQVRRALLYLFSYMQQRFPPTALVADVQHHTRDNPAHNVPESSGSADPSAAAAL